MKVLHINSGQIGGAAWCARRIYLALQKQNVDCRILFADGIEMPDGYDGAIAKKDWLASLKYGGSLSLFLNRLVISLMVLCPWGNNSEKLQRKLRKANSNHLYLHIPRSHYKNISRHPLVQWADIIHLHWVADFVDYSTFFKEVNKPVVWTLHDKYPAMGLQHLASPKYPLPDNLKELDERCIAIKRKGLKEARSLSIVAISSQMMTLCKESPVLSGFPCHLIHNGVDCSVFIRHNVNRRDYLGRYTQNELPSLKDYKTVLFSSFHIWDNNKGLYRVIDAMKRLNTKNLVLVIVGEVRDTVLPDPGFPCITTGLITDQTVMSGLYSCCDLFINASYEETFAQTPLEAMACGIPVVTTPCSGSTDIIRPFNGILCDGFDVSDLAAGLKRCLTIEYDSKEIRQFVIDNFSYERIASKYISLYDSILKTERK